MTIEVESDNRKTPLHSNDMRWVWMATGSGAVLGAVASTNTLAGVRQITLSNQITSGGANTLSTDITGDGVADFASVTGYATVDRVNAFYRSGYYYYRVHNVASATFRPGPGTTTFFGFAEQLSGYTSNSAKSVRSGTLSRYEAIASSSNASSFNSGTSPQSSGLLIPVTFTDSRINGGAPTQAFVDLRAFNSSKTSHTVQLLRTIFNDANTMVPPGINQHVTYREFDPTVYARRLQLGKKIKKLKKKAKKLKKKGNKPKAKKLKKKAKRLMRQLAAIA